MQIKILFPLLLCLIALSGFGQREDLAARALQITEMRGDLEALENSLYELVNFFRIARDDWPAQTWEPVEKHIPTFAEKRFRPLAAQMLDDHFEPERLRAISLEYEKDQPEIPQADILLIDSLISEAKLQTRAGFSREIIRLLRENGRLTDTLSAAECRNFQEGVFYNLLPDGSKVTITRRGDQYTEQFEGEMARYKLRAINSCDYQITLLETNMALMQDYVGERFLIEPYEIAGNVMRFIMEQERAPGGYAILGEFIKIND
ncbi:MAG: hypothetical protein R3350_07240 [Saprospiraceae bacterium]|nr:hypothetical protein [Saprospiraceae bacterium]